MNVRKWTHDSQDKSIDFDKLAKTKIKKLRRLKSIVDKSSGLYHIGTRKGYIVLSDYTEPDRYKNDIDMLINNAKTIITDEAYRDTYLIFTLTGKNKQRNMSYIHFLFNLIMWKIPFALNIPITKDMIFMPRTWTNSAYINHINKHIIEPYKHMCTHNEMSSLLAEMYDNSIFLCEKTGIFLGLSFSLHGLISKWDNQELYDINHTKIPEGAQISEAEEYISQQTQRMIEIYMNDSEDNELRPMLRSGTGVNIKQLREYAVHQGFKPSLDGYTIPMYEDTNMITDGYKSTKSFTLDAYGGRKAAVLALRIGDGGYIARMWGRLTSNIVLHSDPDYDCGSENYYKTSIRHKQDLADFEGRWYLTDNNTLRQILKTDYELIGEDIEVRSPMTCASKHGLCATCYGHLYNQNYGLNIGILSALKLSERNYQNVMSAKHVLNTNSDMIEFDDAFYKYFTFSEGVKVSLREDIDDNCELLIDVHAVDRDRDVDDLEYNEYIPKITLRNIDTDEIEEISDDGEHSFYFSNQVFLIVKSMRKKRKFDDDGFIHIKLSELNLDQEIFFIRIENDELTKPLNELKKFITKGKVVDVDNVSDLGNKLRYLMKCGGISTESIHVEIIIRNLIRDKINIIHTPNWSIIDPEYQITSVNNAILTSGSIITSLTFEQLGAQLKNPDTYDKTETTMLDRLFILD